MLSVEKKYPYMIVRKYERASEIEFWLENKISPCQKLWIAIYKIDHGYIEYHFSNKEDALLFKLIWN